VKSIKGKRISETGFAALFLVFILSSVGWGEIRQEDAAAPLFSSPPLFERSSLVQPDKIPLENRQECAPSKVKAFFLSFLLPGTGEYYAGSRRMAKIFAGTETLLWTTFFSFRVYGSWIKKDYQSFAMAHAGIHPSGKDHQYFVDIEHFNSIREYNEAKLRQRKVRALYPENDAYTWQWDSEASRLKYERLRVASDKAYSNSILVIGTIIVNHIVSGIDAMRVVRKHEMVKKEIHIGVTVLPEGGAQFSLWRQF